MAANAWFGSRLTDGAMRAVLRDRRRIKARRRARSRDVARLMLVVSVLTLGVLAVEIGRKAVTIISHGTVQNSVELTG
ncbi:hypothetical protein [Azospirillum largimobile]